MTRRMFHVEWEQRDYGDTSLVLKVTQRHNDVQRSTFTIDDWQEARNLAEQIIEATAECDDIDTMHVHVDNRGQGVAHNVERATHDPRLGSTCRNCNKLFEHHGFGMPVDPDVTCIGKETTFEPYGLNDPLDARTYACGHPRSS